MTSKQRAYLRGLAAKEDTIFQVGKAGIEETFIIQVDTALEKRELIKAKTLETYEGGPRDAAELLAEKLGAEVVQVIGSKFVLYRPSKKNPTIQLPY